MKLPKVGSATRDRSADLPIIASDPVWIRWILIAVGFATVGVLIVVPLVYVFVQAFAEGIPAFLQQISGDPDTRHAIRLTLLIAPVAVLLNTLFGLAVAWSVTRFQFPGRTLLVTLLDVPFAVSPVVAGLMFVLLFGSQGYFGSVVAQTGIPIIYAWPGILLATTFVTMPFVARELIPLMESLGSEEEQAAYTLGANGWQIFWKVTLPNIKWGLAYGMIQCFSRAIGEFGAVSVVSGHIAGQTDTMSLRVEKLFQEYNNPGAFAVATLLAAMSLVAMLLKNIVERLIERQRKQIHADEPLMESME